MTQRGATRLIVVPYFLTPGAHLQRDLPRLVAEARSAHPHLRIEVTAPLDGHPLLRDIVLDRAREAV
jgi:sirohydrochlorin ferrochelatase